MGIVSTVVSENFFGIYRAKVTQVGEVDNGGIQVFIPGLMDNEQQSLIALPANNALGGYEDSPYNHDTQCMIPKIGSLVYVFFENGNPSEPRYFGSCTLYSNNVPSDVDGKESYSNVLYKSDVGQSVVIDSYTSDKPRVEMGGIRQNINNQDVRGNRAVIRINEQSGKERIEIRDPSGNEIIIMMGDSGEIAIRSVGKISIESGKNEDIILKSGKNIVLQAESNIALNAQNAVQVLSYKSDIYLMAKNNIEINALKKLNIRTGASGLIKSGVGWLIGHESVTPAMGVPTDIINQFNANKFMEKINNSIDD